MGKINQFRLSLMTAALLSAAAPFVQVSAASSVPLVVIRFNQPHVHYDQQLYSAVAQSVAVKPEVMFDIVSNAPLTGDASRDAQWVNTASRNTQAVVAAMKGMGVPMERMHISGQAKAGLRYDETHVYVR